MKVLSLKAGEVDLGEMLRLAQLNQNSGIGEHVTAKGSSVPT